MLAEIENTGYQIYKKDKFLLAKEFLIIFLSASVFVLISFFFEVLKVPIWLSSMVFHELGHAVSAWLCSVPAVPTFFMAVHYAESFVLSFFVVALALLLWGRFAAKTNYNFCFYLFSLLIFLLLFFSLIYPIFFDIKAFILLSGQGGELWLPTLLLIAFYYPMPKYFKWNRNRYILGFISLVVLLDSFFLWIRTIFNNQLLRKGALFDFGIINGGESSGDIDILIREYGWSEPGLVIFYCVIALLCFFALVLNTLQAILNDEIEVEDIR